MSIRELLARTDGEFISLHDVLSKISAAEGVTYQEAAIALLRLLDPHSTSLDGPEPKWHTYNKVRGIVRVVVPRFHRGHQALQWAATYGSPEKNPWNLEDDVPF